jgi:hypothetical protein
MKIVMDASCHDHHPQRRAEDVEVFRLAAPSTSRYRIDISTVIAAATRRDFEEQREPIDRNQAVRHFTAR